VDKKKTIYVIRGSNKKRLLAARLKFRKRKVVLRGEILRSLMFKLRKNGRLVRNSLTMSKRIL
jgi:hypothetical protein